MFRMMNTARGVQGASKRQSWLSWLSNAVDAYATYRLQHAVPEFELQRAKREISRYRGQMR